MVEMCAKVGRKIAQKEKEKHEEKLREMAQKAREKRAGIKTHVEKEDGEARERDEIQHDRRKERQHDWNLSRAAPDKRLKLQRNENLDISEVIALGVPNPRTSNEVQYDQKLFNQSKGMDSGFAGEKMKFTMFMIKPGEVEKIWPRIFTGPVKIWTRTCMEMT